MKNTTLLATLLALPLCAAHAAAPDRHFGDEGPTLVPNAFGLVYEGALSESKPGAVNLRRVEYAVEGIRVAANVYLPADYDPAGRRRRMEAVRVHHAVVRDDVRRETLAAETGGDRFAHRHDASR